MTPGRFPQVLYLHFGVDLGRGVIAVSHQVGDVCERDACHPQVRTEGVAQAVEGGGRRRNAGLAADFLHLRREVARLVPRPVGADEALASSFSKLTTLCFSAEEKAVQTTAKKNLGASRKKEGAGSSGD